MSTREREVSVLTKPRLPTARAESARTRPNEDEHQGVVTFSTSYPFHCPPSEAQPSIKRPAVFHTFVVCFNFVCVTDLSHRPFQFVAP